MITRVGANSAQGATITIPAGHRVGDVIIMFAFRDGSVTNPTIPSGWTNITNTTDGTSCSVSMGWKIATSTSETSGTWTNATGLVCHVYRGQQNIRSLTPFGTITATIGSTNTITFGARALAASGVTGSSWFLGFIGHSTADTTIETAPTNMQMTTNSVGASAEEAGFDTNGPAIENWPATNVSISGTAGNWITVVIELKAQGIVMNNFQFPTNTPNSTGANPGVLSFTEKIR